ncbi:acyltransferase [Mucilaginibacter sp. UR6-11]|uniref:acyltransferase family protein n=1 Tax=Mucilaginibacter sp. UR6-11 TaxID=1435644 RepID=UPI001E325E29|nr:acyltransferase [Mucilaginibacter sp. UR6-11]MCC8424417.1 acyltransferase [Mucilaginibacter sp. UR6-11]
MVNTDLRYYKELDGLRGVAALMVIFFHFMPDGSNLIIHYLRKVSIFGQTGVTLFFVLSGFLITRILLHVKTNKHYFSNFYIKRALRIFPLYYLALVIFYFIIPPILKSPPSAQKSWMYWIYLQNIPDTFNITANGPQHFWSLAVEEHFYLFWPLLIYYTSAKNTPWLIFTVVIIALFCRCILIYLNYGTFYFTFSIMDALAIGAYLAWYEHRSGPPALDFNLIIIISLALMLPAWLFTGGKGYNWVQIIKFPVIAMFYMGIVGKLVFGQSWLNTVMRSAFLKFTGKISYGLYVFHPLCAMVFRNIFPNESMWVYAASYLGLSYAVATLSFYAFERHFLKLKRYFEPAKWDKKQELQFK